MDRLVSDELREQLNDDWWRLAADDSQPARRDDARRVILGMAVTRAYAASVESIRRRESLATRDVDASMERAVGGDVFPRPMGVVLAERQRAAERCDWTQFSRALQHRVRCVLDAGHPGPHDFATTAPIAPSLSEGAGDITRPLGVPVERLPDPADADPTPRHR